MTRFQAGFYRVHPLVKQVGFGQAQLSAAQLGHLLWVRDDQEIHTREVELIDGSVSGGPVR